MPKRVLIVDDDPRFRALARKLLQRSGYAVVDEATDGAGAVASARRVCPDAALIDVQLPDTDGLTLARQLTETDNGLRIVLTSTRDGSAADDGDGTSHWRSTTSRCSARSATARCSSPPTLTRLRRLSRRCSTAGRCLLAHAAHGHPSHLPTR